MSSVARAHWDIAAIMGGLYGDGIIGLKGAFDRAWVMQMREDIDTLFEEARRVPGGALPRGPQRYYVEVHPERVRGFIDMATHPWFVAVCEAVLGPDYRIVEHYDVIVLDPIRVLTKLGSQLCTFSSASV